MGLKKFAEQIFIRSLTGSTLAFDCSSGAANVASLKKMLEAREGIPAAEALLIFGGRLLKDPAPLTPFSTLHLLLRLRGGMQIFIKTLTGKTITLHLVLRLRGGMLHASSGRDAKGKVQCSCGARDCADNEIAYYLATDNKTALADAYAKLNVKEAEKEAKAAKKSGAGVAFAEARLAQIKGEAAVAAAALAQEHAHYSEDEDIARAEAAAAAAEARKPHEYEAMEAAERAAGGGA